MLYLKSEYITIEYFATEELVKIKWLEYASSAEYREILGTFLQLQKEYKIKLWLADYSNAKVVRPVDQQWTVEEWGPKFFSSLHLRYVAIVNPTDVFGSISVNYIMSQIKLMEFPVGVSFFDNLREATAWLALQMAQEK